MKDTISKRDWETISAFLDGQLSLRKQARLESRLQTNQKLQVALEDLRNTRQVLRSAPRLHAPRSFMLTPEMAGQPIRMPRLAPVFGWASAVASFLLVLVLVGDVFSAGGFVPIPTNIPQQDEFIAPREQPVEDSSFEQPAVAQESGVTLKSSAEEAPSPENPEELAPLEVASDPALESAPSEDPTTDSKEIEMFAAAEEVTPEKPEGRAGITTEGEAVFATPTDITTGGAGEESEQPQEEFEPTVGADSFTESAFVSETVAIESIQEQPTEIPQVEEESIQTQEESVEQISNESAETPPAVNPQAKQAEQPSDDAAKTIPEVGQNDVTTWAATQTALAETKDFVLGAEVILALSAFGTGLAWIFLRRRGD